MYKQAEDLTPGPHVLSDIDRGDAGAVPVLPRARLLLEAAQGHKGRRNLVSTHSSATAGRGSPAGCRRMGSGGGDWSCMNMCMGAHIGEAYRPHQESLTLLVRTRACMYTKKTVCMCARIRHSPMEDVSTSGCHALVALPPHAHADVSLEEWCSGTLHYRGRSPPSLSRDQPKPAPPPPCRCRWIWSGGMTCPSTSTSASRPSPVPCSGETGPAA